jgi:hypothetical protein
MSNACYVLKFETTDGQTGAEDSFVGGRPKIPEGTDFSLCNMCGARQGFFLQVAFPPKTPWAGSSLAIFHCTSCVDDDYLIPGMLKNPRGAHVPLKFLRHYQTNFRFVTFDTAKGRLRIDYSERVAFRRISMEPSPKPTLKQHKIGGVPSWVMEDEAPASTDTGNMDFLLQLLPGLTFPILDGAPRQRELDLTGVPAESPNEEYQLFIGNALYLFGCPGDAERLVYAITQVN